MTAEHSNALQNIRSSLIGVGFPPEPLRVEDSSIFLICPMCATEYRVGTNTWKYHRKHGTHTGMTCSLSCSRKRWHKMHPGQAAVRFVTQEQREKAHAKQRGVPKPLELRQRLSEIAKARGLKPQVRGGNGCGMTEAEATLIDTLPASWVWNFPVALGGRQPGYPTCYKLDFAWPHAKVGLEVDGQSHRTTLGKARDAKKTAKLEELGWSLLRIRNQDVTNTSITCKLTAHLTTLLERAT